MATASKKEVATKAKESESTPHQSKKQIRFVTVTKEERPKAQHKHHGALACIRPGAFLKLQKPPAPPKDQPPPITHTVVFRLAGPAGAGKTALCQSWVHRLEPGDSKADQESPKLDYYEKVVAYSTQEAVRVHLWDDLVEETRDKVDRTLLTVALRRGFEDVVREWMNKNDDSGRVTILLLTQADRYNSVLNKAKVDDLCKLLEISAWYTISSCYDKVAKDSQIDSVFHDIVENIVSDKKSQRKKPSQKEEEEVSTVTSRRSSSRKRKQLQHQENGKAKQAKVSPDTSRINDRDLGS